MIGSETQMMTANIGWSLIHFLWQGTLITFAYWLISRNIKSIHAKYWTGMSMTVLALTLPITYLFSQEHTVTTDTLTTATNLTPYLIANPQLSNGDFWLYFINSNLPYLVFAWAMVVLFLSVRLIRSWLQLAAIKHDCEPAVSGELKQFIKNFAIQLDLHTIPILKVSQQVLVPAAYGALKPTVLLPLSLISQIPREQLEAIIKHELCHLKRNDFIHNIIQLCADIVFFFHPGIRWMNNDIRHVREQCCDQMVLSHNTETLTYAKALTNIAEYTNGLKLNHSIHLGINDGALLNRVKFLLQDKSSQSSLMIFMPFILLVALGIMMIQPDINSTEANNSISRTSSLLVTTTPDQPQKPNRNALIGDDFYPKLSSNTVNYTRSAETIELTADKPPQLSEISTTASLVNMTKAISKKAVLSNNTTNHKLANVQQPRIDQATVNNDSMNGEINQPFTDTSFEGRPAVTSNNNPITADQNQELASFAEKPTITPKFQRYVAPEYPVNFWMKQIEQDVIATFKIRPDGRVSDIRLKSQKNTHTAFEQEVEKAIKKWRFDVNQINQSTLQSTYQRVFSFAIAADVTKNCQVARTGSRLAKAVPCNK